MSQTVPRKDPSDLSNEELLDALAASDTRLAGFVDRITYTDSDPGPEDGDSS